MSDAATCKWTPDLDVGWKTSCGQAFELIDGGTPIEHDMNYCYHCGKRLVQGTLPEDDLEDEVGGEL